MKTKMRRLASLLLSIIIVSASISFSPFMRMDVKAADWIFIDHIDWTVGSSFSTANIKNDGFSIGMYGGNNQSDSIISVSDFLSEFGLYLDSITGSTKNWFTSNAASSTCYPAYVYKEAGLPNSDDCIVIYYGSWGIGNEKSINPLDKSEMSCWLRFCMIDVNTGIPYVVNMYYRSSSELNDSTIAISYDENTIESSSCVEPNDELYSNCKLAGRVSSSGKYHANIESLFRYIYGETSVNNMVSNMNSIENTLDKVGTDLFSITSKRDSTKVTFSITSNDTAYTRSNLNGETSSFNDTCEFVIGGSTNDLAGSTTASNDLLNSFNTIWNENVESIIQDEPSFDTVAYAQRLAEVCNELDIVLQYVPNLKATTKAEKENVNKLYQVIFDAQKALDDLLQDPNASNFDVRAEEELIATAMEVLTENKENFGAMSMFMRRWWANNFVIGRGGNTQQEVLSVAQQTAGFINTINSEREELNNEINEALIVEYYNR